MRSACFTRSPDPVQNGQAWPRCILQFVPEAGRSGRHPSGDVLGRVDFGKEQLISMFGQRSLDNNSLRISRRRVSLRRLHIVSCPIIRRKSIFLF